MSSSLCPDCGAPLASVDGPSFCPGCLLGLLSEDPPPPGGDLLAGTRLGECYLLEEIIGEGGFAVVWRASQLSPVQRTVAVKWLKAAVVSPQVLARFEGERSALARMQHAGVATVLDAGSHEGRPFFVVELVSGEALTTACATLDLDTAARCRAMIRICEAVQHAHAKGVVHRDLKPSNLLAWLENGTLQVKVIDFGVARALADPLCDSAATALRQLVGTPGYMSPEQAEPGQEDVDVRSDVFALGVVLYEVLSGQLPFPPLSRRAAALSAPPWPKDAPVKKAPRSWQRDLLAIADRALALAPAARYAGAQAMADDLQRVLDEQPVAARPQRGWYALGKLARRHRLAVALGALALISLIAGLAVSLTLYLKAEKHAAALRQSQAAQDRQSAQRWKSSRHYPGAIPALARSLGTLPDPATAADLLAQTAYGRFAMAMDPPLPLAPEWGKLITTAITGRTLLALMSGVGEAPPLLVIWTEKGGRIGAPRVLPLPEKSAISNLTVSGGGARAAVWGREQRVWSLNLSGGPWIPALWPEGGAATAISLSRDGQKGLIATEGGFVWQVSLFRAEAVCRLDGSITAFQVQPGENGAFCMAGTSTGKVCRWPQHHVPAVPQELFALPAAITSLTATRNGHVIFAGDAQGHLQWTPESPGNPDRIPVTGRSGAITALTAGIQGKTLFAAYSHGVVRAWDTSTLEPLGPQAEIASRILQLSPSGGIDEIMIAGSGGSLRMWHTRTGQITPLVAPVNYPEGTAAEQPGDRSGRMVHPSPDGRSLLMIDTTTRRADSVLLEPWGASHLTWMSNQNPAGLNDRGELVAWQISTLSQRPFSKVASGGILDIQADGPDALILLASDGSVHRHREGQPAEILCLAPSPVRLWQHGSLSKATQRCALAASDPATILVRAWAGGQAQRIAEWTEPTPVTSLAMAGDGLALATGHADGTAGFCQADGTQSRHFTQHPAAIQALAHGPGHQAATGSADGLLILWDTQRGEPASTPLSLGSPITQLSWASTGGRLAAATSSGITLVDTQQGTTMGPPLSFPFPLNSLAINESGTFLAGSFTVPGSQAPKSETLLWPLPPTDAGIPGWFGEFATALSGQRFTPSGQLESAPPANALFLASLIPADDQSPAAQLARWLSAPTLPPGQIHPWLNLPMQTLQHMQKDWPSIPSVKRSIRSFRGTLRQKPE